jgi:hypothetical protein
MSLAVGEAQKNMEFDWAKRQEQVDSVAIGSHAWRLYAWRIYAPHMPGLSPTYRVVFVATAPADCA